MAWPDRCGNAAGRVLDSVCRAYDSVRRALPHLPSWTSAINGRIFLVERYFRASNSVAAEVIASVAVAITALASGAQ